MSSSKKSNRKGVDKMPAKVVQTLAADCKVVSSAKELDDLLSRAKSTKS